MNSKAKALIDKEEHEGLVEVEEWEMPCKLSYYFMYEWN